MLVVNTPKGVGPVSVRLHCGPLEFPDDLPFGLADAARSPSDAADFALLLRLRDELSFRRNCRPRPSELMRLWAIFSVFAISVSPLTSRYLSSIDAL